MTTVNSTILFVILITTILGLLFLIDETSSCNEQVCASVVSKCMLTQSCKCDLKNCSCCKECFNCLSYLYSECCSCVDMCPKPNETRNLLSKKSHVEDLEGIPGLFQALTDESDEDKWSVFSFPVDFNNAGLVGIKDFKYILHTGSPNQELDAVKYKDNDIVTVNCTVVYMSQCLSWNKCKQNCQSMGATSYRWFHDGCCECVGDKCINYGINESRCILCPENKNDDDIDDLPNDEDLDYGEGGNGPIDSMDTNF